MNIFQQMIRSLYAPKDIALFRFQGIGKTLLYVFLLMAIASIPSISYTALTFSQTIQQIEDVFLEGTPDFKLENGILVSPISEPYIHEADNGVFILDPEEVLTRDEILSYDEGIILSKRYAYLLSDGVIDDFRYRDFGNITITKDEIAVIVTNIAQMLPLIITFIALFGYLFVTAMKFIGITVLAVIGYWLRNRANVKAPYRNLWIMSAYAITIPTLLFALLESIRLYVPFSFTIYWIVAITILYLALRRIPKPRNLEQN